MNDMNTNQEPCQFRTLPTGAEHVESKQSIEAWRTEKSRIDRANDVHDILGCVGEPLANVLRNLVERDDVTAADRIVVSDRATEARGNLLDWTNEHRSEAYSEGLSDAASCAGQVDPSDCLPDDLATCTLEEACEHTRDQIERDLEGSAYSGGFECRTLDDSDLS